VRNAVPEQIKSHSRWLNWRLLTIKTFASLSENWWREVYVFPRSTQKQSFNRRSILNVRTNVKCWKHVSPRFLFGHRLAQCLTGFELGVSDVADEAAEQSRISCDKSYLLYHGSPNNQYRLISYAHTLHCQLLKTGCVYWASGIRHLVHLWTHYVGLTELFVNSSAKRVLVT
jgi:hypothetical protein